MGHFVLAVIGSRDWRAPAEVKKRIDAYIDGSPLMTYDNVTVISGGAQGVDTWVRDACRRNGLTFREFRADWDRLGKRAGYERNRQMVEAADMIIAFWNGSSKGTKHTIDIALALGRQLEVIFPEAAPRSQPPAQT